MKTFAWAWPVEAPELDRRATEIGRALDLPRPIAMALATRDWDLDTVDCLRTRTLAECTRAIGQPDGVERAAKRLLGASRLGRIGILCDYDVDGATSQAILIEALRAVFPGNGDPFVTVPRRNREGFGPNERCMAGLAEAGVSHLAVLDCGTAAGPLIDGISSERGVAPVVVDHHPPHSDQPPESAVLVNPWVTRSPDPGEQGTLCAAGLTWFVARAILRLAGLRAGATLAVRKRITLLAALGTACDVMPVNTPFNRSLLRAGLRLMDDPDAVGLGIASVAECAGVGERHSIDDFGWRIGPRLNAGSRMGESDLASRCLREANPARAQEMAVRLDELNRRRVQLGQRARRELDSDECRAQLARGPVNVHVTDVATPGTVGLLASSVVREFGWPAIALAMREDGSLAGSGRSSLGFDLGLAVNEAKEAGILDSGGGHAAACGVGLEPESLEPFRKFMMERFDVRKGAGGFPTEPTHIIDARLPGSWLRMGMLLQSAEALTRLAPWGQGLRSPLFGIRDCQLAKGRVLKNGHLLLNVVAERARFEAVWWNPPPNWAKRLGLLDESEFHTAGWSTVGRFDLAGSLQVNEWRGRRSGRIVVRDARPFGT
ncbi:MAG: DHHA1 domain-containing protein [Bryobacterales bacterium]|nr:DHHA1 domain-containing protein [Bryobacterales bacterium]